MNGKIVHRLEVEGEVLEYKKLNSTTERYVILVDVGLMYVAHEKMQVTIKALADGEGD